MLSRDAVQIELCHRSLTIEKLVSDDALTGTGFSRWLSSSGKFGLGSQYTPICHCILGRSNKYDLHRLPSPQTSVPTCNSLYRYVMRESGWNPGFQPIINTSSFPLTGKTTLQREA